jgi:Fe-S oxidoreductase
MERAREGRWGLAYKLLRNAVIFPAVVCDLCPAPCERACQRKDVGDEPVNIRGLEAAAVAYASERNKAPESYRITPKTKKIAIIGAGPTGLSCALNLAQKKYPVTIFDRNDRIGGSLTRHARYAIFAEDFALQFSSTDVAFRLGAEIESLNALADYDAVYVATGKGGDDFGAKGAAFDVGRKPPVFIGGEVCGVDPMRAIADGAGVSRAMEAFFQTGNAVLHADIADGESSDAPRRARRLAHEGVRAAPRVNPSRGELYSEDEALRESRRCMLCDCTACLDACEMLRGYSKWPQKIAVEAFIDLKSNPPFSSRSQSRETYSCSMCGVCKSVCPEGVDLGKLFQRSREGRRESGKYPYAFHDFWMRDMDFAANEAAYAAPPPGRQDCAYVFFPGCKLASSGRYGVLRVASATRRMLADHGAGIVLDCCGAPALWAGERELRETHMDRLRATWARLGRPVFIFACAYCEKVFREYLPEIEGVSIYEMLARDSETISDISGSSSVSADGESAARAFAVFDPCAARACGGASDAVRILAQRTGVVAGELSERNRCCGFGGHMQTANPELYGDTLNRRATLSDKPYLVYCANCEDAFLRQGKACTHILDIVFGDLYGPDSAEAGAISEPGSDLPHLQEKRDRMLALKRELASIYGPAAGEAPASKLTRQQTRDYAVNIIRKAIAIRIPDDVRAHMNRGLILDDDVAETILAAEQSGDKFMERDGGVLLACLVKPHVTYWVEYRCDDSGAYEVYNVYSHRMRFEAG